MEIAATIGSIVRLVCVAEVQDVQDFHFGIIGELSKAATSAIGIFLVGDSNQSICALGQFKIPESLRDRGGWRPPERPNGKSRKAPRPLEGDSLTRLVWYSWIPFHVARPGRGRQPSSGPGNAQCERLCERLLPGELLTGYNGHWSDHYED